MQARFDLINALMVSLRNSTYYNNGNTVLVLSIDVVQERSPGHPVACEGFSLSSWLHCLLFNPKDKLEV